MEFVTLVLALFSLLPALAEEPQPAASVALVSASQAARAFLVPLDALDPRGERLQLDRLEARRLPADEEHVERARCDVDLRLVGADLAASRAAVATLVLALETQKSTLAIETGAEESAPDSADARVVHVRFEFDPSKAVARELTPARPAIRETNPLTFIRKAAVTDRIELGDIDIVPSAPEPWNGGRIKEAFAVESRDKLRLYSRVQITNFAAMLEREDARASVTALEMTARSDAATGKRGYRMRLELSIVRPARADEKR